MPFAAPATTQPTVDAPPAVAQDWPTLVDAKVPTRKKDRAPGDASVQVGGKQSWSWEGCIWIGGRRYGHDAFPYLPAAYQNVSACSFRDVACTHVCVCGMHGAMRSERLRTEKDAHVQLLAPCRECLTCVSESRLVCLLCICAGVPTCRGYGNVQANQVKERKTAGV